MSKKTDAIYECLQKLDNYQNELEQIKDRITDKDMAQSQPLNNPQFPENSLDDINFGIKQELKTLRFWIESLYKYNGKSRSISKKNASVANGKKGGRPPKEISDAKLRINQIENEIIPAAKRNIVMADSNEDLEKYQLELEKATEEMENCRKKIEKWQKDKISNNKSK